MMHTTHFNKPTSIFKEYDINMELSTATHIEKLKRQKQILAARIQKAESLQKQRDRKADTRRKILLGAYFLEKLRKDGTLESIKTELDNFLTRNNDRALFGLPALETETS
jgi:hypothetical protein